MLFDRARGLLRFDFTKIAENITDECSENIQCETAFGEFSECARNQCACKSSSGFLVNKCYQQGTLGGSCQINAQCLVGVDNNTQCDPYSHRCSCLPGTNQHNGRCWSKKKIWDSCVADEECSLSITGELSHCDKISSVCVCQSGLPHLENTMCAPFSGGLVNHPQIFLAITCLSILLGVL